LGTLEVPAQNVTVREGEEIVTSGDGALVPAGLPVGLVHWDGGSFRAALFAEAGASGDVRILDLKAPPEQPPAPSPDDLPVTAAGLAPLPPAPHKAAVTSPAPAIPAPVIAAKPAPAPAPDRAASPAAPSSQTPPNPDDPGADNQ